MTFEKIGKLVRAKEAERRAKLSPEERAEEDRRREERRRREDEEYLAKKDATVPLLEYERDFRDLEALLDLIQGEADERLENLADTTLDKLQAKEAELKAARARIDALLDANLKAQDMRRKLDQLAAQVGDLPKGLKAAAKEGAKAGVEGTLPKVYAKAANMSDEELRNAAKPKTRSSGGGRKFEKDIGCKQAKAALKYADKHPDIGLRAACAYIIRTMKDGDFEKPYTIAQHLDTAVRRYCKRTSRPIPSKGRSGKWSAKS